jgi:hypothetical protein
MVECITRSQFLNNGSSYKLQKLPPGNYSLRVRAMSLAGYGEYTELRYFYIKVGFGKAWHHTFHRAPCLDAFKMTALPSFYYSIHHHQVWSW